MQGVLSESVLSDSWGCSIDFVHLEVAQGMRVLLRANREFPILMAPTK